MVPSITDPTVRDTTPTQESNTLALTTMGFSAPSVITRLPSALVFTPVHTDSSGCLGQFSGVLSIVMLIPFTDTDAAPVYNYVSIKCPKCNGIFAYMLIEHPLTAAQATSSGSSASRPVSAGLRVITSGYFKVALDAIASPHITTTTGVGIPTSV